MMHEATIAENIRTRLIVVLDHVMRLCWRCITESDPSKRNDDMLVNTGRRICDHSHRTVFGPPLTRFEGIRLATC